jgi:pimeloyl-ACP methyl ester carboxylesterase
MGFGAQMLLWPERFCEMLAERGYRAIRYDSRDVGLSSRVERGYGLEDMAADAVGLLDALDIPAAHVVGASMGGFIAQLTALRHPARVKTLCSIMSSTGDRTVGQPRPEMIPLLLTPLPLERSANIEYRLKNARLLSGGGYRFDEARLRETFGRMFDRGYDPAGVARHAAAVMGANDRTAALAAIRVPTLVIHGDADPIVDLSGGQATARAIPGAELQVVPRMGHELPEGVWEILVEGIVKNAAKARR